VTEPIRYHLMGIEGVGMSALAEALAFLGHDVDGCDLHPGSASQRLSEAGIIVYPGHDPDHLPEQGVLVASNAVPEDHPELIAARRQGLRVQKRIQALADLLATGPSLGVTGTHGKTTTTAMLGAIFQAAGQDPMVLVGARVPGYRGGARLGKGPRIAEVDESDRHFPEARVDLAVLTNLEDDHVGAGDRPTYHQSQAALREAVGRWLGAAGQVVFNADWPDLTELLPAGALGFGLSRGEVQGRDPSFTPWGSRFTLVYRDQPLGQVELRVPGRHNLENALAAATAALVYGLPYPAIREGLSSFRGTGRRFELVGEVAGARVYDDYAHHPTEVEATLKTARGIGQRVRVVFQPHRYLRTARFADRFARALALADEAIVLEVYPAGEPPIPGVSGARVAEAARRFGAAAHFMEWNEALAYLRETVQPGDLILTMGAGDVWKLGRALVEEAQSVWK